MEPWYKAVTPRPEVREGRSFHPDEFAIALEQVVAGKAPADYQRPDQFFARTVFTQALREHAGMVLRRLSGQTENAPPVMALVTQFGGGKTHTLAFLYHVLKSPAVAMKDERVKSLLKEAGVKEIPKARVAVFVGNAWDPGPGKENPWLDVARQLAGEKGVAALGPKAKTTPPGTEALGNLFQAAGGCVLVLMDEVLNFLNRHRDMAEPFYAFLDNLVRAMTGAKNCAAMVSLPRSQVEMTPFDLEWQEKINKVVRRVARELIVTNESEIAEVVRRRLFEDLGPEKTRAAVAKAYADWCFERRAQLPPEWTDVDTTMTDARAREFLRKRFEACYPFHPATLSVFQRKWQTLPQYQQTRGTLAMLAQWVSWAYREGFQRARNEPLVTLGSAPLDVAEFRATLLGQLGEPRLKDAIETDIAGSTSHSRALDADSKGALKDLHRRVGAAILFESSGGMVDRVGHLPELRFAIGEPGMDTTSIDTAAENLERRGFYLRKVGTDGFRFGSKPTLKKVVGDRKASLDEEEIRKEAREAVKQEFERGATVPLVLYPEDSTSAPDTPRLTLVILEPETALADNLASTLASWTREHGKSPRLHPASLIWCVKKAGRDLREKTETSLAWKRVSTEIQQGIIGGDFEAAEREEVRRHTISAEGAVKDEVWASYRFILLYDPQHPDQLRQIDLGAGHASGSSTLTGRVLKALRDEELLNETIGAGYLDRSWPPSLKETGVWPLQGLRQAFMNGSLTRLSDPERVLRERIPEFVERGEFGLGSGQRPDGTFERVWFKEALPQEEVVFDAQTFLLRKQRVETLRRRAEAERAPEVAGAASPEGTVAVETSPGEDASRASLPTEVAAIARLHVRGEVPPEVWNRLGTKLLPKLRTGQNLSLSLTAALDVSSADRARLEQEIRRILQEMGLGGWTVGGKGD